VAVNKPRKDKRRRPWNRSLITGNHCPFEIRILFLAGREMYDVLDWERKRKEKVLIQKRKNRRRPMKRCKKCNPVIKKNRQL